MTKSSEAVVWFTGLSGSGKSSVAREVELVLVSDYVNASVLDDYNIRHGLNRDLWPSLSASGLASQSSGTSPIGSAPASDVLAVPSQ